MLIEPQLGVEYGSLGDFDGTECGRPSDFGRDARRVIAWRRGMIGLGAGASGASFGAD